MSTNKVNSKTSLLEFKRKHNLLVDKVDGIEEDVSKLSKNIKDGSGIGSLIQIPDGEEFVCDNPNSPNNAEIVAIGATGDFSSSFGGKSVSIGKRAHSEGTQTIAEGNYSHAEGNNTHAIANNSHTEGLQTTASGSASHSEGNQTLAKGNFSHAEGNQTKAEGSCSHTEGTSCRTLGNYSHCGGRSSNITGDGETAFAHGEQIYLNKPHQIGLGKYNYADGSALFMIGDGTADNARVNAFSVRKNATSGEYSIKVGSVEITESQLTALLALLN